VNNKPGNAMTDPSAWLTVNINGVDYVVPAWRVT